MFFKLIFFILSSRSMSERSRSPSPIEILNELKNENKINPFILLEKKKNIENTFNFPKLIQFFFSLIFLIGIFIFIFMFFINIYNKYKIEFSKFNNLLNETFFHIIENNCSQKSFTRTLQIKICEELEKSIKDLVKPNFLQISINLISESLNNFFEELSYKSIISISLIIIFLKYFLI